MTIPADIQKAAEAVRALLNDCPDNDKQAEFIASALLAERERCAKVAEDKAEAIATKDDDGIDIFTAGQIVAAAIRKGDAA